mgnify:CR=1 FL=1
MAALQHLSLILWGLFSDNNYMRAIVIFIIVSILSIGIGVFGYTKATSSMEDLSKPGSSTITNYPNDHKPSSIDLSKYQMRMRWIYHSIFSNDCTKCHSKERALNAPFKSKAEWKTIIERMSAKKKADISTSHQKSIETFLIYDAKKRK